MKRAELAALVASTLDERHVVVCGLGSTTFAWKSAAGALPTYYTMDPMGLSAGFALGFALAEPDREIVLLVGDGDLLMNLAVLPSIVEAAPPNLRIVVFNNARYETGGSQPLPAGELLSFAGLATSAGFPWACERDADSSAEDVAEALDALLAAGAPGLLAIRTAAEPAPYGGPGDRSGVEERVEFQRRLEATPAAQLPSGSAPRS